MVEEGGRGGRGGGAEAELVLAPVGLIKAVSELVFSLPSASFPIPAVGLFRLLADLSCVRMVAYSDFSVGDVDMNSEYERLCEDLKVARGVIPEEAQ